MSMLLQDWRCPHCLESHELELYDADAAHEDQALYVTCDDCDKTVSAILLAGKLKVVALTPDGDTVEICGYDRSPTGSVLCRIKPLREKTFPSGINPFAHSRLLHFEHETLARVED